MWRIQGGVIMKFRFALLGMALAACSLTTLKAFADQPIVIKFSHVVAVDMNRPGF
jgi:hypothetical protein